MNVILCVLLISGVGVSVPPAHDAPPLVYVGSPPNVGAPPLDEVVAPPPVGALPQDKGETVGPFGASTIGDPFDDGAFDGVRTVTIYMDEIGVTGLKVRYVAKDKFHIRERGNGNSVYAKVDFEVAYPEEFITAINGSHSFDTKLNTNFVSSLSFVTSYGRTSELFGCSTLISTPFVLESHGRHVERLMGFLGASGERINTLGARFGLSYATSKRENPKSEIVLPPIGGISGFSFDDGVFDGVRKLTVRKNTTCISYLRIQYVQDDKFESREHGSYTKDQEEVEFEVEYPEEYITAMIISWSLISTDPQVMAIELVTSYSRSEVLGTVDSNSKKYMLKPKTGLGPKIVGFIGRSSDSINAVGARFYLKSSTAKTESDSLFLVPMFVCFVLAFGVM